VGSLGWKGERGGACVCAYEGTGGDIRRSSFRNLCLTFYFYSYVVPFIVFSSASKLHPTLLLSSKTKLSYKSDLPRICHNVTSGQAVMLLGFWNSVLTEFYLHCIHQISQTFPLGERRIYHILLSRLSSFPTAIIF
jgi:hypothetical protein